MVISNFSFEEKSLNWKLQELHLNKLTLLVGASGVGKTQILNSINNLKSIADGESLNGVKWSVTFKTINDLVYNWEGEFENKGISVLINDDDEDDKKNKSKIQYEKLYLNGDLIVSRENESIVFLGEPTIKLSQQQSIVSLLKEEDKVKPAYEGIKKIRYSDQSNSASAARGFRFSFLNASKYSKKYDTLSKIQESDLDTDLKLYFVFNADPSTFELIKERFIDIFPQVEDVKVAPLERFERGEIPDILKDYPYVQIKEKGVEHWISQNRISSGMYRTLIQLSDLYLCSDGTIYLVDEFENSLGINCIDEITNDILNSNRNLQFILTSHHPYIIDSIPYDCWKLVTRTTGIVKTHDLSEYNFGKSKHSAFMQLLQLDEYQTGSEVE
ncbi:hypothetical protein BTO09_13835 [Gilvibacter sp. SZ-19]|uniref:AAA family ATPase n=1 Tax=Gilvibacter sp. SZ-19 TaxID=754429 RepID=UPI000B3BEF7C|nr:AAA family ATPase [Gilvibacter sp. SZ-19]ARV13354.1 hypothetical protein BTO09_13835 [Gilvibacter sp. SZ-19]